VGIPAVSVAHGWTAATWKVRLNEALDRLSLRGMDRVVCVSEAQARRVRRVGVPARKLVVIHNAIDPSRFEADDPSGRSWLLELFPDTPRLVVGAVGRLSPEKGFGVLVEAAAEVLRAVPDAGFVHFGDGPLRGALQDRINALGLERRFVLAGFHAAVHRAFPYFDLFTLPSYTEGLPCVVLEAFAAGVPVVATAVGGTPEVVADGYNGYLVEPGDPAALAGRVVDVLRDDRWRPLMGERGRRLVLDRFTFEAQSHAYRSLFASLFHARGRRDLGTPRTSVFTP
jgi:glycosyltransferase involved in cell wall biosynthesis